MAMKHEIHHGLELPLAKKAIDRAMAAYSARFQEYNPTFRWTDDTHAELGFRAKGVSVAGDIEVRGAKILLDIQVPFLLRVFKGKAMDVIDREVKLWVEKARNGELD